MVYTAKKIAQACVDYVVPMCNTHHTNRLEVLETMAVLIAKEISHLKSIDPVRNLSLIHI